LSIIFLEDKHNIVSVNTIKYAKTPLKNIEKYLGKCDHDSHLKGPMASIATCVKNLQKDFEIVNHQEEY
jgi:hypothetical protein